MPKKAVGVVIACYVGASSLIGNAQNTFQDEYNNALSLYEKKEYEKSYTSFKKLFFEDMTNKKVNLYLAKSAYDAGYYNDAVAAYERVLINEPDDISSRVGLGITYFTMRLYEQAEIEFNNVLIRPVPAKVRATIEAYMKKIEEAKMKHFLSGMLTVAVQDDTNINNGNSYTDILPNPAVSDTAGVENLMLMHSYKMNQRDYYWMTKANLYAQQYNEVNDYNLLYPNVETGVQYRTKDYTLSFPIGIDSLTYGGVSRFSTMSIAAQYDKSISSSENYSAKAKISNRKYVQTMDNGRDSRIIEIDGRWQKIDNGTVYSALGNIAQEKATKSIRPDVDNTTIRLGGGFYKKFYEKTAASISYNLRNRSNADETNDGSSTSKRSDMSHMLGCSLINELDKRSYLTLYFNYTQSNSNQKIFEYDKRVFGVSYTFNFDHDWITNHPDWKGGDK